MQLPLNPSEQKKFRKTALDALREAAYDLANAEKIDDAKTAQQKVASIAIMILESYGGFIEDNWRLISEDIFHLGTPRQVELEEEAAAKAEGKKRLRKG